MTRRACISLISSIWLAGGLVSPALGGGTGAPALTGFSWGARTGAGSTSTLHFTATIDAPAGLASGRLRLASRWHTFLLDVPLEELESGSHAIAIDRKVPGASGDPWELIAVELVGADGRTTSHDLCGDLARLVQTRESLGSTPPNIRADCVTPAGWVVYTIRTTVPLGGLVQVDTVGVTLRYAYAGAGWVLQDAAGAITSRATALMGGDWKSDDVAISAGDTNVVVSSTPDPTTPNRLVHGIGSGNIGFTGSGLTYRLAVFYAARAGSFEAPWIMLRGTGFDVVSFETGPDAGLAYGSDFHSTAVACNSAADRCLTAQGEVSHTATMSHNSMFYYFDLSSGAFGVTRIEGPSAPPVATTEKPSMLVLPRTVVAGRPGAYRYLADASSGQSWGKFLVVWADMPITPQQP